MATKKTTKPTTQLVAATEGPPPSADAAIDRVVRDLTQLQRSASLDMANAVGKLIIDGLYGGDLAAWRSRGAKDTSFRKLSEREDLPMRPTTLYQSVAVYELVQRLGLSSPRHLGVSHLRTVLGLQEADQVSLLRQAEDEAWTVVQLTEAAEDFRRDGRGGGRPVIPLFVKALHAWTRVAGQDELYDEGHVANLKPEQLADARQAVAEMQRQLAALAARLGVHAAPEPAPPQRVTDGQAEPQIKARRKQT